MNATVRALTVLDDGSGGGPALYAAGDFTTAGGVAARHIAKWDGSTWSPLGSGVDAPVATLAIFDNGRGGPALYAAGEFTTAGGVPANHIATWNNSTWSHLGGGLDGPAYALAVFDDGSGGGAALYAGGSFTTAGPAPASQIARWNGTRWSSLGSDVDLP